MRKLKEAKWNFRPDKLPVDQVLACLEWEFLLEYKLHYNRLIVNGLDNFELNEDQDCILSQWISQTLVHKEFPHKHFLELPKKKRNVYANYRHIFKPTFSPENMNSKRMASIMLTNGSSAIKQQKIQQEIVLNNQHEFLNSLNLDLYKSDEQCSYIELDWKLSDNALKAAFNEILSLRPTKYEAKKGGGRTQSPISNYRDMLLQLGMYRIYVSHSIPKNKLKVHYNKLATTTRTFKNGKDATIDKFNNFRKYGNLSNIEPIQPDPFRR